MSLYELSNKKLIELGDLCEGGLTCERAEEMGRVFNEYKALLEQADYFEIEGKPSFDFVGTNDISAFEEVLKDQLSILRQLCYNNNNNKGLMYEKATKVADAFATVKVLLEQHPEYRNVNLNNNLDYKEVISPATSDVPNLDLYNKLKNDDKPGIGYTGKKSEEMGERIYEPFIGSIQRYFSQLEERMSGDDSLVDNKGLDNKSGVKETKKPVVDEQMQKLFRAYGFVMPTQAPHNED